MVLLGGMTLKPFASARISRIGELPIYARFLWTYHNIKKITIWVFPKIVVSQNYWFLIYAGKPCQNGWFGDTPIFGKHPHKKHIPSGNKSLEILTDSGALRWQNIGMAESVELQRWIHQQSKWFSDVVFFPVSSWYPLNGLGESEHLNILSNDVLIMAGVFVKLVMFYGFYISKSPFFTTVWGFFNFLQAPSKQTYISGRSV